MEKDKLKDSPAQLQAETEAVGRSMAPPAFSLSSEPIQRTEDPVGPGYYAAGQTTREIGFALRHPIVAMAIGSVSPGSTNISTNAVRFSTNDLGLQDDDSREGTEVNAFRHALWQSEITQEYGADIAHQVGNAHEANPFAISGDNASRMNFPSLAEADQACDLRNNIIGRSIGTSNDQAEMNVLALRVLEYFHTTGLWVAVRQENGTYNTVQRRMADDQYEEARERLLMLNANGFDPAQQAARDAEARRQLEQLQIREQFGPKW